MKILSISFGLAAIACVAAQAAPEQEAIDPLAAAGAQTVYAVGKDSKNEADAVGQPLSAEQFAIAASEMRFRSELLAIFNQMMQEQQPQQQEQEQEQEQKQQEGNDAPAAVSGSEVEAEALPVPIPLPVPAPSCSDVKAVLAPHIERIRSIAAAIPDGPLKVIAGMITKALDGILNAAATAITAPIRIALLVFKAFIGLFAHVPVLNMLIAPLQGLIKAIVGCNLGIMSAENNNAAIDVSSCSVIADMYRLTVAEVAKTNPSMNMAENANEELRRLAEGSMSILDLMSKNSIAATNENLLVSRPIFAADVLNQFREELLLVEDEMAKNYAQVDLALAVAVSNALEACLVIASDPVAAAEELDEEMEAAEEEQDEIDEEEDD
ncbi:hypothetical protein BG004_000609 [Podila humilis]|nr:hypothetical protein BG004_000609 [Podila humilis]